MSGLSAELIGLLRRYPAGIKRADIFPVIRKPQQEIDAALSQLRRQGYIRQSEPGVWKTMELCHPGTAPPRSDVHPEHHAIPARLDHLEHRLVQNTTTSLIRPPPIVVRGPKASTTSQETTMPKGTKKCTKCGNEKGLTAFHKGDDVCRGCHSGKAKPKARGVVRRNAANRKLRAIVEKHTARKTNGSAIDAVIAKLTERGNQITQAIATLHALG